LDLLNGINRKMILDEIKGDENEQRKSVSYSQYEIYKDKILPHVKTNLGAYYSHETMLEMPIIATINLARRIVHQEAGVYKNPPKRIFTGVSPEVSVQLEKIYQDMTVNHRMMKANVFYKLQDQAHVYVRLINGKLKIANLMNHQLDAVPNAVDSEIADAYLISGYDVSLNDKNSAFDKGLDQAYGGRLYSDNLNQKIADADDKKSSSERYAVWSKDLNFIMDGKGNIVSGQDPMNPIMEIPVVDISQDKDHNYWAQIGTALTDFTIQFNSAMTDLNQIVRMQGFAQAWYKGASDMIPENLQVGTNLVLKLAVNPNNPVDTDFGFANPNPDIAGSISYLESLLSAFLTSRGLDARLVSTKGDSVKYASGLERLLAMIELFEPSKQDFDVFKKAEKNLFKIIKAYINTYAGTDLLSYDISMIPDDADVEVVFHEPQSVITETEKLDLISRRLELGLINRVEAVAADRNISIQEAEKLIVG
jgi:hypothetical protein